MYQAKDLFLLQTEFLDAKVDIAANRAIDRVVDQIAELKKEVHDLKDDMNKRFGSMEVRLAAVETRLGMRNEAREQIRNRFIEYVFKAGSLALAAIVSAIVSGVVLYLHHL